MLSIINFMHPLAVSLENLTCKILAHRAVPHKERVNDVPTPFVTIILRLKSGKLALRPVQVHVQNESSLASQIARFVRATLK